MEVGREQSKGHGTERSGQAQGQGTGIEADVRADSGEVDQAGMP